ncbi:MAG TPA: MFS transporter, partial [Aquabacterium sp.]|nr:MFS transporter [Aquabacterium sp.]
RHFTPKPPQKLAYHLVLWRAHLRQPGLRRLFIMSFALMGGFVTVYNYAGFLLQEPPYNLSQTQIGLIFLANVFGIVASSIAGGQADRHGRAPVLMAGVLISLCGLGLSLVHSLWAILGGVILLTAGFFISHAVASAWVGRLAKGSKGHASSLYLLTYYIGSSTMGTVGGWFWQHGHWPGVATLSGLLSGLTLFLTWQMRGLDEEPIVSRSFR